MDKQKKRKMTALIEAKELLLQAVDLCEDALEGDINADAYFLSRLREISGLGGNPYNQTIDTMIDRLSTSSEY
jgi:hypothetical protein